MKTANRNKRERGSAAIVEGSLILLVLLSMLVAIVDFGQFLFIHQTLTERAREAVRYGIVNNPTDTTSIQNVVLYGQASGGSVPNQPSGTDQGIFNLQRNSVIVSSPASATDDYRLTGADSELLLHDLHARHCRLLQWAQHSGQPAARASNY